LFVRMTAEARGISAKRAKKASAETPRRSLWLNLKPEK